MCAFFEQRLLDHLDRYRGELSVEISNLSSDWFSMALQGPKSKATLAPHVDVSLEKADFPGCAGKK